MQREGRRESGTRRNMEGPVQPGTVLYRILQWIAREVARSLQQPARPRDKPRAGIKSGAPARHLQNQPPPSDQSRREES
jgi:hypothetical protein